MTRHILILVFLTALTARPNSIIATGISLKLLCARVGYSGPRPSSACPPTPDTNVGGVREAAAKKRARTQGTGETLDHVHEICSRCIRDHQQHAAAAGRSHQQRGPLVLESKGRGGLRKRRPTIVTQTGPRKAPHWRYFNSAVSSGVTERQTIVVRGVFNTSSSVQVPVLPLSPKRQMQRSERESRGRSCRGCGVDVEPDQEGKSKSGGKGVSSAAST